MGTLITIHLGTPLLLAVMGPLYSQCLNIRTQTSNQSQQMLITKPWLSRYWRIAEALVGSVHLAQQVAMT
jgi:hypothetical protein